MKTYSLPSGLYNLAFLTTEEGVSPRITHAKGKLSIPEQMGDLSELVSFLTSRNPRIEVTRATS